MKAMQCRTLGGPENLTETVLTDPVAGDGEVVVDVQAAGVNFPDGLIVAGTYQTRHEPPFVPGCEVAGTVRTIGAGVTGLTPGDRVTAFCGLGGYAEQVAVAATKVHRIPDELDIVDAATVPVVYGTSYHGLVDRANLQPGETLLVLGASGGVGLTAVQIGKALGARVIAAASSPEKLQLAADHRADELIDYRAQDLAARLRELAPKGVDVVYDPVGGDAAQAAVKSLAWGGRFLTVGYASGDIPRVGLNRLLLKEGAALGVLWGAWAGREPEANSANMSRLFELFTAGSLRPVVSRSYPLADASAALAAVMGRAALGKIALRIEE
ncbi:NADPH:quinone oxidoreductase family protein [Nakamurella lactea]|uniref:NADPH:quinone oxidoreductase family protein n=1 Tax=Nakamurella lactea TaxID=459515 RepID=UPI00048EA5D6|nr:NADPH:quinone oxidoreductase family protein [Nakamurella lactea]